MRKMTIAADDVNGYDPIGYQGALLAEGVRWDDRLSLPVGNQVCNLLEQGHSPKELTEKPTVDGPGGPVPQWMDPDIVNAARMNLCPNVRVPATNTGSPWL